MPSLSALARLAADISASAKRLDDYLTANDLPHPSFDTDAPADYTYLKDPEARQARAELANAGRKLNLLMTGHTEVIKLQASTNIETLAVLNALCYFNVPEHVPFDKGVGFEELAAKCGLSQGILTRFVRMVETSYIFEEKKPGIVSHTAVSKLLATEEGLRAAVIFGATEVMPAAAKIAESLRHSDGQITGFELVFGLPFFEHKKQDPEKNGIFAKTMSGSTIQNRCQDALDCFDWGRFYGTLVDVGGSIGHIDVALAAKNKTLKFIVEDIPQLKCQAETNIASNCLSSRISFMGHDFFAPQPDEARNASVYLLSNILHDWTDEKCVEILQQIVPAMRPDSSIILIEHIFPDPADPRERQLLEYDEAILRARDISKFALFRASERSLGEFEKLMSAVDKHLKVAKVAIGPTATSYSIIEFSLRG